MKLYKEQCSIDTVRYDTRCYFNVRSKANMSQLNLPMRDISFSLTALLTFGTLYLQQSFLAPVWLILNEIWPR